MLRRIIPLFQTPSSTRQPMSFRNSSSSPTNPAPRYHIVFYDYVHDYLTKREPIRASHFKLAREWASKGNLLMGGAFNEPVDGAALVFKNTSASEIENDFVKKDPYVINGLVSGYKIRNWTVVLDTSAGLDLGPK
eukprot:TRINITY_DN331_c0_g1_i1.p1 TRINITY_DN331_c0_g1~~TRINITY_DN331_c0_g1_i1.p1  ORF type:complete len:135 (-),score=21.09 TRINITY_DN331_c0_g1_i1:77-481(-)